MSRANAAATLDEEGASILYKGANMSQMSILFKVDDRILKEKMHGIQPVGKRGNAAIYDVAEVAARMGKLTEEQVDGSMKRLNHKDLPKELTKEYWNGKRAKQAFLKEEGDLWPTEQVVEGYGGIMKIVKMSAKLMADAVERRVELSDRQRQIIVEMTDAMLRDCQHQMTEHFRKLPTRTDPKVNDDDDL